MRAGWHYAEGVPLLRVETLILTGRAASSKARAEAPPLRARYRRRVTFATKRLS